MNGLLNRLSDLEARFERLRLEEQDARRQLTQALQQVRDIQAKAFGAGGGGSVGYFCPSIPAIAGGGNGTADVYQLVAGADTLVATGATIYNRYPSATTAGRVCTLAANADGTYLILAQSCT